VENTIHCARNCEIGQDVLALQRIFGGAATQSLPAASGKKRVCTGILQSASHPSADESCGAGHQHTAAGIHAIGKEGEAAVVCRFGAAHRSPVTTAHGSDRHCEFSLCRLS